MLQRIMGLLCLSSGFVLLIAAMHERMRVRLLRETAVFTGRVIGLRSRQDETNPDFRYHEATVSYTVEGTEYRSVLRILPGEVLPLPGTRIRLSCFPWSPERLRPAPAPPRRNMLQTLCIGCVLFLSVGTALCLPL